jgi:anti-anti-sigma regulatory factor
MRPEGDKITVHRLVGHISFRSYEALAEILAHVSVCGTANYVLDVSAVTFIDTFALSMILVAQHEAAQNGIRFTVEGATDKVAYVMRLAQAGPGDEVAPVSQRRNMVVVAEAPALSLSFPAETGRDIIMVAARDGAVPADSVAVISGAATQEAIEQSLCAPYAGFFEVGDTVCAQIGPRAVDTVRQGGLVVSVSTAAAMRIDLARLFADAIQQRFKVGRRAADSLIDLCLTEAIGNAVIHGNLGVDSTMRTNSEGARRFRETMNHRLAMPELAGRRIEITLRPLGAATFTVSVADQGQGFDISRELTRTVEAEAKCGRGISLIRKIARAVWSEDGGRCLVMLFQTAAG